MNFIVFNNILNFKNIYFSVLIVSISNFVTFLPLLLQFLIFYFVNFNNETLLVTDKNTDVHCILPSLSKQSTVHTV